MVLLRQYLEEVLRAGLVLAVLLFGFGSTAPAPQVGRSPALAAAIAADWGSQLCGGGFADNHGGHLACHACRVSMPLLPPPPCVAEPAFRDAVAVDYVATAPVAADAAPILAARPRGPPARA
jgi:hypothetical protein